MYNDERAGVGTHFFSFPEKDGRLARPDSVPTPARGNQKTPSRPESVPTPARGNQKKPYTILGL